MIGNKLIYCLRTALRNIRRNIILNLLAASTIAVTFIVFVSFLILLFNLSVFKKNWLERLQVIVYLNETVSAETARTAFAVIEAMPEVASARAVSKEEALLLLQTALEGQDGILEGLSGNPLPPSIEIKLKIESIDTASLEMFVEKLRALDAVDDVEYGQKWFERFRMFFEIIRIAGACLGGLLFLFALFIISNTIRLMIFIRREEIEIMRLVGATNRFIKLPYCIEGMIQGLCGAACALTLFFIVGYFFLERVRMFLHSYIGPQQLVFIDFTLVCYILLLGIALGLTGSLLSLNSLDELQR